MNTRSFRATPRGVVTTLFSLVVLGGFAATPPAQLSWTERVVIAPPARVDAAMTHDPQRHESILFGGFDLTRGLRDTWSWNGTVWTQLSPATSPPTRWEHAMVWTSMGVVLFGGQDGVQPLGDTWMWNGTTWRQIVPTISPPARRGAAMAFDQTRNKVVLFGGVGVLGAMSDLWEFEPTLEAWVQVTPASSPVPQSFSGMSYDPMRSVCVLFGGLNASQAPLNQTWTWNGTAWTQRAPATNPPARSRSPLGYRDAGFVVMFGGQGASAALADTWQWNGTNWQQLSPAAPIPAAGSGHALCYHPANSSILLFGGRAASGLRNTDTWEWNGTVWTPSSTALPAARRYHAMAFDSARNRTVVFSGTDGTTGLPDTWEWDGIRWRQRATTGPGSRYTTMAFDSARGRTFLFGGFYGGSFLQDTWSWNGTTWQQLSPATVPTFRAFHVMAYDSVRQRTVMFGGMYGVSGQYRLDTWEFDGTNWAQRALAGPPGRDWFGMAFDSARGRTVLTCMGTRTDTWEWDGSVWVQAAPARTPAAMTFPSLAYDSARARSVLVGATDQGPLEVWEWDGANWSPRVPAGQPPVRDAVAMVYDSSRRCVVMFGGRPRQGAVMQDTWEYSSGSFASWARLGTGCLGSNGIPELIAPPGSLPVLGDDLRLDLAPLPMVPTPAFVQLGFSKTSMGGIPLPLDLTPVYMPGCTLYQSANFTFPVPSVGGAAHFVLPIPQDPSLLGMWIYNQGLVVDRNANPLGLIWSNAGEGVIGS